MEVNEFKVDDEVIITENCRTNSGCFSNDFYKNNFYKKHLNRKGKVLKININEFLIEYYETKSQPSCSWWHQSGCFVNIGFNPKSIINSVFKNKENI